MLLDAQDHTRDIRLFINSPGGSLRCEDRQLVCVRVFFCPGKVRLCEICGLTAKNVVGKEYCGSVEVCREDRSRSGAVNQSLYSRGVSWTGKRFCSFFVSFLVIAFVLQWVSGFQVRSISRDFSASFASCEIVAFAGNNSSARRKFPLLIARRVLKSRWSSDFGKILFRRDSRSLSPIGEKVRCFRSTVLPETGSPLLDLRWYSPVAAGWTGSTGTFLDLRFHLVSRLRSPGRGSLPGLAERRSPGRGSSLFLLSSVSELIEKKQGRPPLSDPEIIRRSDWSRSVPVCLQWIGLL
ncbi:hypothetical protein KSP40_PGU022525 [Platanthera guangdongensis]|uniref:ATP-dependent Clp protease proteolytic subunit n=1 Tax=Platanthera guangdongensis TaxID=2320717 RepID=A0ABR2M043_9ASPA